jgi:hypothetical protein
MDYNDDDVKEATEKNEKNETNSQEKGISNAEELYMVLAC